jgi:type VI secretion system protein ImpJ
MSRKPIWSEGLFVSQHHFQAQDHYHELLLRDRIAAIRRFDWGVLDIEIDDRLLQAGQFRLRRLEAVWPDGILVRCGGASENAPPEARSFEGVFAPELTHLDVLVGIAAESASAANLTSFGEPDGQRRFSRVSRSMPDFNTGGGAQEIEVAVPSLRVLFGPERQDKMSALPVAQLVRQAGGQVIVRDTYVPPVLRISAAPFVTNGLQRALGAMTSRQRELASKRKQKNAASIEFHYTDARQFWLLHTLNGSIPLLTHLLQVPAHPEEVYIALTALVAQLCTFAAEADPTSLPRFDYNNLGEVFEQLFARVLSLLSIDSVPPYVEVPLERRQDGMFVGKIPEPRILNHEFYVAVQSGMAEALVRERIPNLLKVAAWNQIFDVVKQARHAVRTEVDFSPSSSLPIRPGLCFFRLRREGPFWEEIAKTSTLALYIPREAEWKDTLLFVYAIDPRYLQ